jgi:hypothetical protein
VTLKFDPLLSNFAFNFSLRRYNVVCNGEKCNPAAADGQEGTIKIPLLEEFSDAGQTARDEVACLCCSKAVPVDPIQPTAKTPGT